MEEQRVIRVFVSSTFRDMQAERDILIKKIFPQLRKICEERAVSWTEVDLRWGITTEEASEGKVLSLCLAEIQRCRPYFIGLLGERYGWVPREDEIPEDLLETQSWLKEHREHSVTEMEILHGVLRDPAMADRSIFYFRDPAYLSHLPVGVDPADFATESSVVAEKLADLKSRIRAEYASGKLLYQPREKYPDPEALGELVLEDFKKLIDQRYPIPDIPDPLDQEAMRHEAYAQSRRLAFIGRENLLDMMDKHVSAVEARPLVLTGESGCGKSALLAEWAAQWHQKHPEDLVIQHYIGSTQESADWQGLVRRILGELKRAFTLADELPMEPDALRAALQDWLTKTAGQRQVVLVLDALNQISADDLAARQLGWLPVVFPTNVRLLVSSLPGESLESIRRRNWPEMNVPLFDKTDIASAAMAYFDIFSKKLPQEIIARLEATPAATNALYLRAVLDELRQFGKHKELETKTAWYLTAPDLPDLFNRILTRWDEDFGQEKEYPDLVRRSLCLIACTRFGLSEAELLDLLGKKEAHEKDEPLPRRYWSPFFLAAENALVQRAGLLTFGHDYLRAAVHRRWLKGSLAAESFRNLLADYFGKIPEPTNRKLDELPALLRDTAQWERLKDLLADLPTFLRLRTHRRWKWELHGYWLQLEDKFDPVAAYNQAISAAEPDLTPVRLAYLLNQVASFHQDAGLYKGAEPLFRRSLEARERGIGKEHPDTLGSVNNLAALLYRQGDYAGAEPLYRRALEAYERVLGKEHPDTLTSVNNLAGLLDSKGDYAGAELLYRRALEACERVLGKEHPDTLTSVNNLALLLYNKGDYAGAEPLFRRSLEARERVLGKEHPDTLTSVNNLAGLVDSKGDYAGAELLYRRALEARERVLGKEHPNTLTSVNNLAALLYSQGDYAGAEPLYRRALEAYERVLGKEHPDTLQSVNNLAGLLRSKGDYAGAELLYRRALEARERVLGKEHPDTLQSVNSLAILLYSKGDYAGAEPLCRRSLEARERVLGKEHPNTLTSVNNLALLLYNKGDYAGAEPLYRRSLEAYERVLGKEHPDMLTSVNNLAGLLRSKGDYAGAEPLYRRSLEARERVLGKEHPDTLGSVNNLALLLYNKGDYAGAEPLYRRSLEAYERVLGKEHPDTLTSVNNLAGLLRSKGDYAGAEPLYRRVVVSLYRISQQIGSEHPGFKTVVQNYLGLLMKTGLSQEQAVSKIRKMLELELKNKS